MLEEKQKSKSLDGKRWIILILLVITTMLDFGFTIYNITTRPVVNEINPAFVRFNTLWTPVLANVLVIFLVYRQLRRYFAAKQFWRYLIISTCIILIILHTWGAWTNVKAISVIPDKRNLTPEQIVVVQQEYQATPQEIQHHSKVLNYAIYGYILSLIVLFKTWQWVEKENAKLEN